MKGNVENFEVTHKKDVLVRANYKQKLETNSGIIITAAPSVVDDRPTSGVVVKKGEKVTDFDIGSTVYFSYEFGHDIYFDDNKEEWYILLNKKNILGYN